MARIEPVAQLVAVAREGVASLCSFVPAMALAACLWYGTDAAIVRALAAAVAVMAIVTVYCTSGIYTSLKTIHAWHNNYVLPGYLLFALLGGASCLWMLEALIGSNIDPLLRRGLPSVIIVLALLCVVLKLRYWRFIDTTRHAATPESATGLGRFGQVRSVEWPHTEENYLTREMGFVLARKHSRRLREIALFLFGAMPVVVAVCALLWPALTVASACVAILAVIAGAFVERWLFFAEARHVVMLYYRTPEKPA